MRVVDGLKKWSRGAMTLASLGSKSLFDVIDPWNNLAVGRLLNSGLQQEAILPFWGTYLAQSTASGHISQLQSPQERCGWGAYDLGALT